MNQQQPGWQPPQPPQQGWATPPPPPKKNTGKIIGIGCAGIFALFIAIGIISAALGGGSDDTSKGSTVSSETTAKDTVDDKTADTEDEPAEESGSKQTADDAKEEEKPKVVFKVWGTAPAGALGPLDITYGSDSDSREGAFQDGTFEATLPLDGDALYYVVTAQLQGSGDINCSVTVDGGQTKKGHASGGYNICSAQLSSGLLGGWD